MLARVGFVLVGFAVPALSQTVQLVSQSTSGVQGNGDSRAARISADGNWVVFKSDASTLVPGDSNGVGDIFLRHLGSGTTTLISIGVGGAPANGESFSPAISADGSVIAFQSSASNLVAGDTNNKADIFVWDAGVITRVSVGTGGVQSNGASDKPSVSDSGAYVAFESVASNLVIGDTNGASDIFRFDRGTGSVVRASVSSTGAEANGASHDPSIESGGQRIAFTSWATNLFPNDMNASSDVVVRDLVGGTTVSPLGQLGLLGNGNSDSPSLSWSGVAFRSDANNLVPGDLNGVSDVFFVDWYSAEILQVSSSNAGVSGNAASFEPEISSDGGYVCFASSASNLVTTDTNGAVDVFRWARMLGSTYYCTCEPTGLVKISGDEYGATGNGASRAPSISQCGRITTYKSDATNLVPGDVNGIGDVFVRQPAPLTWYVDASATGPGFGSPDAPFASLSDALDNRLLGDGDEVLVWPGTYFGGFVLPGHQLTIRSVGGSSVTYLDGGGSQTVIDVLAPCYDSPPPVLIAGFTIQNGSANHLFQGICVDSMPGGGGVAVENAYVHLQDCAIVHNRAWFGSAVAAYNAILIMEDCAVENNVGDPMSPWPTAIHIGYANSAAASMTDTTVRSNAGTGVNVCQAGVTLVGCTVSDNANSGASTAGGDLWLTDCTIGGNANSGVSAYESFVSITASVLHDNGFAALQADEWGTIHMTGGSIEDNARAIAITNHGSTFSALTTLDRVLVRWNGAVGGADAPFDLGVGANGLVLTNCSVIGNAGGVSGAFSGDPSYVIVRNSVIWGNSPTGIGIPTAVLDAEFSDFDFATTGPGVIQTDPLCWDLPGGDARLLPGSPCIDSGDPASPPDPDGSRVDMGAIPFDPNYCGTPRVYCTAKPNSLDCNPSISWTGTPSLAGPNDDFHITASNVLNNKNGLLFWGTSDFGAPFQGGTLCVKPPIVRTNVQTSGGNPPPNDCSGSYDFHLSQAYMQQSLFQVGTTIYAQYWSRDPGFSAPNNVGLTDALRVVVCP